MQLGAVLELGQLAAAAAVAGADVAVVTAAAVPVAAVAVDAPVPQGQLRLLAHQTYSNPAKLLPAPQLLCWRLCSPEVLVLTPRHSHLLPG